MILLDTSVWIDHLRRNEPRLVGALSEGDVLIHPLVTAEVALGSIARRDAVIAVLDALPQAPVATYGEVMHLTSTERLHGIGIGYVDAHLLASTRLAGAAIWTRDERLQAAAERLGVAAVPEG